MHVPPIEPRDYKMLRHDLNTLLRHAKFLQSATEAYKVRCIEDKVVTVTASLPLKSPFSNARFCLKDTQLLSNRLRPTPCSQAQTRAFTHRGAC
jgi:hypothetical protein